MWVFEEGTIIPAHVRIFIPSWQKVEHSSIFCVGITLLMIKKLIKLIKIETIKEQKYHYL